MSGGGSTTIKDTKSQKALASIAAQRFNLYQQYYVPLENEFMGQVAAMTSPESFENVESYVTSLQQPEFQNARRQLESQAFTQGADPTSGQYQAASAQAQQAQAAGMGRGGAEDLSGQVDRYYQGMENIIAMGQGQAGQAMSGLGDVANIAQKRGRAVAQESMGDYTSALGAIGTGAGLGYGYFVGQGSKSGKGVS